MLIQAQRGDGIIGPAIRNMDSRSGLEISTTPWPFYPRGKTRYPLYKSCVGLAASLDVHGESHPTEIRSPDLPARSESLYRPCCPIIPCLMRTFWAEW